MNTMQKVTTAIALAWVAVLCALSASAGFGPHDWLFFVVFVVANGIVGAVLVAVFVKGTVIARLQKGIVVLAVALAAFTLATSDIASDRYVPGWQRRLAQYPALRGHHDELPQLSNAAAMDAADSIISEYLLSNQPELWRDYGSYVVACARKSVVPVETVVAVMQRETAALRQHSALERLDAALEKGVQGESATLRQHPQYPPELVAAAKAELDRRSWIRAKMEAAGYQAVWHRRLDSLVVGVVWKAKSGRRRVDTYAVPSDAWVPNWPARLALAGSELLAGFAIVIVLGLLRRKPRKAIEADRAA